MAGRASYLFFLKLKFLPFGDLSKRMQRCCKASLHPIRFLSRLIHFPPHLVISTLCWLHKHMTTNKSLSTLQSALQCIKPTLKNIVANHIKQSLFFFWRTVELCCPFSIGSIAVGDWHQAYCGHIVFQRHR